MYLLLFILSQIYFEKRGLPGKTGTCRLRYLLLGSIGLILLVTWISGMSALGKPAVIATTIVLSSGIAYKYRTKFEAMERGEQA